MLVAIVALALCLNVGAVALDDEYVAFYDSLDYDRYAVTIAAGNGYPDSIFTESESPTAFRPPVYPYLLGAVYAVAGDHNFTAGRLLEALFVTAIVLLLYLVGSLGWGQRVGLVAAGLGAVYPPFLLLSASLVTEPVFLAMELLAVWAVLMHRASGTGVRWAALAGAACGLAVLTRSNGALLLLPVALGLWWPWHRAGKRSLVAPAVAVTAAVLTVAPWTIRNAVTFDRLVPVTTQSGFALAGEYNDEARTLPGYPGTWRLPWMSDRYAALYDRKGLDEAELDSLVRARAREYVLDHPSYLLRASWLNLLRTLEVIEAEPGSVQADLRQRGLGATSGQVARFSFYAALLVALLGAVHLARRPSGGRGPLFLWLIPPLMLAAAAPFQGSPRYRTPVDPFLLLLAAIALVAWLARRRGAPDTGPEAVST